MDETKDVVIPELPKQKALTNHERVIASRAKKLGITVADYKAKYPKGYEKL